MEHREWGLVLAGGGGKGAYQIGVMKALAETEIWDRITHVSGASVGALNAALVAGCGLEKAEEVWKNISPSQFLDIDVPAGEGPHDGVFSRAGLVELIEQNLDAQRVAECPRQLTVSLSRIEGNTLEAEYAQLNGRTPEEIRQLLLASSALPVIYQSVEVNGKAYRDGGLKDNVPIRPLHEAGLRHLVVVALHKDAVINACEYPGAEILPIIPSVDLGDFFSGTLDFTARGAVRRIEAGYADARRVLEWYLTEPRPPYQAFLESYHTHGAELEKQLKAGERRRDLQTGIDDSLQKVRDLMKKYGIEE